MTLQANGCAAPLHLDECCCVHFTVHIAAEREQFAGALIDTGLTNLAGDALFDCLNYDPATGDCKVHGTPAKPQVCLDYGPTCPVPDCAVVA